MQPVRKRKSRQKARKEADKAIKSLVVILCSFALILSASFLIITNEKSSNGLTIQQLERERKALKEEEQALMIKIAEATAVSKLEESEKTGQMQPIEEKIYITQDDNAVANIYSEDESNETNEASL